MTARSFARAILSVLCVLVVSVSAEAATVTLTWDRNPETNVQGYVISYGTASRVYSSEINVGNQVTFTFTLNPATTTTFYFVVQAYNSAGRSGYSAEVNARVDAASTVLTIDRPVQNAVLPSDMLLSGWALDQSSTTGTGVDAVHAYAYPASGGPATFLGVASYGAPRPDVAAVYGARFVNSGYSLPIAYLPPGTYDLTFYAHSAVSNSFSVVRTRRITVYHPSSPPPPSGTIVNIDLPVSFSTINRWLAVGGWAIDLRGGTGTGVDLVQVLAYPNPGSGAQPLVLGNAQYGRTRDDVAAAFGNSRFRNSGFFIDVIGMDAGVYDIVTLVRNTVTGSIDTTRVRRVTIDPAIVITVDGPASGASVNSPFVVNGWAIDRRSTTGTGVDVLHVWAYSTSGGAPTFVGEISPSQSRTDVAAAFGARYRYSGYSFSVSGLPAGTYDLVIYAHSSVTAMFENIRIVRVTIR